MKHYYQLLYISFCISLFWACNEDDNGVTGQPIIESVSFNRNDSTVLSGIRSNLYAIHGQNLATTTEVYFNEYPATLNRNLITNETILVRIDENTPYSGTDHQLRVVTLGGETSIPFQIEQPAPEILDFSPASGGPGTEVTITGEVFDNVEAVLFGETEAEIISATPTELVVIVPDGIAQAYITIITPGGEVTTTSAFGLTYVFYTDEFVAAEDGWQQWGWGGTDDYFNTEQVLSGQYSIKRAYEGQWGGYQIGNGNLDLSQYQNVKISIFYDGPEGGVLNMVFNDDYGNGYRMEPVADDWTNFTIPVTAMGDHATLNVLAIQEACGCTDPVTIYIDDFGLN